MKKMAIVGPIDGEGKRILRNGLADSFTIVEVASRDDYLALADVDAIVLRTLTITADDMDAMPRLRHIQRWGVGYDSVDVKAAGERGIAVSVAAGTNAHPVSEYVLLLMLAVLRNLIRVDRNVRAGKWRDPDLLASSYSLAGKTVGLVGFGNIGRLVANKAVAFGAKIVYHDIHRLDEEERFLSATFLPLERLAEEADIVSIHLPLVEATRNLIDAAFLKRMKKTAVLINTARGGIVDETALYHALANGELLGAGLDVFEREPVDSGNPLLTLDNIVVSSHFGGTTADLSDSMARKCVENVRIVATGGMLKEPDLVNAVFLRS